MFTYLGEAGRGGVRWAVGGGGEGGGPVGGGEEPGRGEVEGPIGGGRGLGGWRSVNVV